MVASIVECTTSSSRVVKVDGCTVTVHPPNQHSCVPEGIVIFSFDYRIDGTYVTCQQRHSETGCLQCTVKCDATRYSTLRAFKRAVRNRCLNALDTVLEQGLRWSAQ